MVLGETEITGQVKTAYEAARTAHLTGRVLNRVFQKAFQTVKEIRNQTSIAAAPPRLAASRSSWRNGFSAMTSRTTRSSSSVLVNWVRHVFVILRKRERDRCSFLIAHSNRALN